MMNPRPPRLQSVDSFRGFAIIAMVLVNFIAYFDVAPSFLQHAKNNTISFADLVAPFFLFALGMMYRQSFIRRLSVEGRALSYFHAIRRYSTLLAIGMAGGCLAKFQLSFDWGILQAIGLAGIISLAFIELNTIQRMFAVVALLVIHGFILSLWGEQIQRAEHGGPLACISWATIILLASIVGDLLKQETRLTIPKNIFLFSVTCVLIGLFLLLYIPVSKPQVSPSYIMISTGVSGLVYLFFLFLNDGIKFATHSLQYLGKNALLIFLVHYVLVHGSHRILSAESHIMTVVAGVILLFLFCTLLAYFLDKKRWYLTL